MAEEDESGGSAPELTLREMMFYNNADFRPLGVTLPEVEEDWELDHSLLQILPKFSALPREDPCRHLQDFEMVCGTVKAKGPEAEYTRLIAFPFSLHDGARDWFYSLPKGSVKIWGAMQQKFLERYYPKSRIPNAKKEIYAIQMGATESLYDYWGRFKQMLAKCPLHQLSDQDLILSFVHGLRAYERRLINVASGGSILNKSPNEAFKILEGMAEVFREEGFIMPKALPRAPSPISHAQEEEIGDLSKVLKAEEHRLSPKIVGLEERFEQRADDILAKVDYKPMGKAVVKELKEPEAEVEKPQSTLPPKISNMSLEDGTFPRLELAIDEEGKVLTHLGREKDATDSVLPNVEGKVSPVRPQRKLDLIKRVLTLVMMCLMSCCQRESQVRTLPKTSNAKVQNKKNKLLPQKFQGNWSICKGHQNFIWEPGGQEVKYCGHDPKYMAWDLDQDGPLGK